MSSTRKYWSAFMIAVYGSGSPIIPAAYRPGRGGGRAPASAGCARAASPGRRRPPGARAAGTVRLVLVAAGRPWPSAPRAARRRAAVRLATASVTWKGRPSLSIGDDVRHGQTGGLLHPVDQVAPQPARAGLRVGRDDDLLGPVLARRRRSSPCRVRVADLADRADPPCRGSPRAPGRPAPGRRRRRHRRRSRARLAAGLRHAQDEADVLLARSRTASMQLAAAERLVGDDQDGLRRDEGGPSSRS